MDLFTLVAKLVLDSSEFEGGVKRSKGLFSKLGGTVGAGAVAMGNLVSTGISKAAGAIFDFGKESLQTGIDFEAAMDKVAAISGTTGTKFDDLVDKAMEMGAVTKFSATESAEAFQYMAMAGWDADQMMAGISGVMDLAAASGENLGTVSDIVTDVLTAMGKSAGDAGHFADVLAAASSSANTNVGMMGETFKYAAPIAGALGYSIEDLALATGLMANAGIKGSQAGTGLRAMLTRLAKPTKDSQEAMNKLGISLEKSDGSMKSLREVVTDMRGSFEKLTESEQAEYAALLAGQEAMSGLLAIVGASDEEFNKLVKNIDESKNAAKTMADIMMDNVSGSLEELSGAMETFGLTLFEDFKNPIKVVLDFTTGFVDKMTKAYKSGGLIEMFKEAGKSAAEVVGNIAEQAPKIAQAAGAFIGSFGTSVIEQMPDIIANVGEALSSGVEALFSSAEGNAEANNWMTGILSGLTESVSGFFAGGGIGDLFSGLGSAIFGGEGGGGLFSGLFGGIGSFLNFLNPFDDISGWFTTIATDTGSIVTNLEELLALEITEDFTQPITAMATDWQSIATNLHNAYTDLGLFVKTKIEDTFKMDISNLAKVFAAIETSIGNALVYFSSFIITEVPQKLLDSFDEIKSKWEEIASAIQAALSALEEFLIKDEPGFHSGKRGSYAVGLDYVPYDNFSANLHRGEAVLTRSEAEEWRAGNGGRGGTNITVNQTIFSEAKTAADLMREARWEQERGVLMAYV